MAAHLDASTAGGDEDPGSPGTAGPPAGPLAHLRHASPVLRPGLGLAAVAFVFALVIVTLRRFSAPCSSASCRCAPASTVPPPLAILDAHPTRDAMAVVYSGDGGWRDLDKVIAEHLQAAGVPILGVDSLRYVWSARSPRQVAADLQAIIDAYSKRWNVSKVYLVGYPLGADILPSACLAMDEAHRATVDRLSLLALGANGDDQISVGGWLGIAPGTGPSTLADLARIPASIVQCFYGSDDADSVRGNLRDKDMEVIETTGGHRFDGDYRNLVDAILR